MSKIYQLYHVLGHTKLDLLAFNKTDNEKQDWSIIGFNVMRL